MERSVEDIIRLMEKARELGYARFELEADGRLSFAIAAGSMPRQGPAPLTVLRKSATEADAVQALENSRKARAAAGSSS